MVFLLSCASAAFAQDGSIPILQKGLVDSLNQVFTILQNVAIKWLGVFMILQFTWTNWHLLMNDADITKVIAKFAGSIFWFCICIYIFHNGSDFLKNVSNGIMNLATGATGVEFDPIQPISTGIDVASQLLETLDGTQSILESFNIFPAIMMGLVSVVILAVSAVLAFKILMVFIETKMVIALSPLSFALLGLNAFRDQGLAPFKYLVSMGIRMFLYGAVLAAMGIFSSTIIEAFKALPAASDPSVWPPIWAAAMGYLLLGAVAWRVDSIAVMLASGSSQMSTGDAAAVGAAAGAAAGVAVGAATGGASTVAGAAKSGGSMVDYMKNLAGGTVANAGQNGAGPVSKPDSGGGAGGTARQSMASPGGKNAALPAPGGDGDAGAGALHNPRARPPGGGGAGASASGNPFMSIMQAQLASSGEASQQAGAPAAQTQSWQDAPSDGGGNMRNQIAGDAKRAESAAASGGDVIGAADKRSRDGSAGGGDGFAASVKDGMARAQASEKALPSTPQKPQNDSAGTASIGKEATMDDLQKSVDRLTEQQAKAGPRKPSLSEEMSKMNQRTENAAPVHIQMNTNQSD